LLITYTNKSWHSHSAPTHRPAEDEGFGQGDAEALFPNVGSTGWLYKGLLPTLPTWEGGGRGED
jgi:hypothetical protein